MLENQLNLLDKLFEEWKKTDSQEVGSDSHFAYSKDGIICSDEYGKNNPKLLFIAKEPNAGGVYNSDIFWIKNFLLPLFLTGFTHCHACVVQRIYKNTDRLAFGLICRCFFIRYIYFVQRLPDVMDLRALILLPTNSKSLSLKSSITQQPANMRRIVIITIGM